VTTAPRKICVVTGSRAEYGALYWLLKSINADRELELQIAVTGMHLSHEFGLTYQLIEQDGFSIGAKVEMLLSSDSAVGVTKSLGLGVIGFADALQALKPDILVLTGDRFEMLAAAQAGLIAQIPTAHIGGGESTEGLIDEAIRHAVTKMSQWHFVATDRYRARVIQLGENPENVWNVGAINLDNIQRLHLRSRSELEDTLGIRFGEPTFLVTYHPVTLSEMAPAKAVGALLGALNAFPHAHVIFTKSNADTKGRVINDLIDAYVSAEPSRRFASVSLGQLNYLSVLKLVDAVIGNSSSGIIEAPCLKTPTVNIGARQQGRVRASSIVDCCEIEEDIVKTIQIVLSEAFQEQVENVALPYGSGGASGKIKERLKQVGLRSGIIKRFQEVG
jgi:UDP-hydrolysing UDP-N-acetyl-D-glucosamine 2-epimerase